MQKFWRTEKILSTEEAGLQARQAHSSDKKIVTVNGSFDPMHGGHVAILEEAKQQGDVLFVGLNSDKTLREGKGKPFPIIPEDQRAAILAAMICVDYVVIIDAPYGTTHNVLLELIQPNVHANSSEFGEISNWAEYPTMEKLGVQGYLVEQSSGVPDSSFLDI